MAKRVRGDRNLQNQPGSIEGLQWHQVSQEPIAIGGLPWFDENQDFGRLPKTIRPIIREPLAWVAMQASGVCFRLRTNSRRLAITCRFSRKEQFRTNSICAESGFDIYLGTGTRQHFHCNLSPDKAQLRFSAECTLPSGTKDICVYAPILNPIAAIQIGLEPEASVRPPKPFTKQAILFYGSSITQGFCCSRPGLTYPAQVCRALQAPLLNFGFGGNARGDLIIADQIAKLAQRGQLSAFVYDYDHNCPSPEELRKTHAPFFKRIRKAAPQLPILIVSSPNYYKAPDFFGQRLAIIKETYTKARQRGDKKVWFLSGKSLYESLNHVGDCTIDNLHPNDLGFAHMAEKVYAKLKTCLGKQ